MSQKLYVLKKLNCIVEVCFMLVSKAIWDENNSGDPFYIKFDFGSSWTLVDEEENRKIVWGGFEFTGE